MKRAGSGAHAASLFLLNFVRCLFFCLRLFGWLVGFVWLVVCLLLWFVVSLCVSLLHVCAFSNLLISWFACLLACWLAGLLDLLSSSFGGLD